MQELTGEKFFLVDELYAIVSRYAAEHGWKETPPALDGAMRWHKGQTRKGREGVPYIYHPLMMSVHALSLGIDEDEVIAVCLLHDVCEDCGVLPEDLPVSAAVQRDVALLTRQEYPGEAREVTWARYYGAIQKSRTASLVKILDRCSNIAQMSIVFDREKLLDYLEETVTYVMPLFDVLADDQKICGACFALRYHMLSVISTTYDLLGVGHRR